MKQLITTEVGGHPLTLEDFGFIQNAAKEAIEAVCLPFAHCIISGCTLSVSGGTWQCSAGWINLFGFLYKVPAHDTTLPAANATPQNALYAWTQQQTMSPSPVVYHDLTTKNVHIEYYAVFKPTSGGFGTPPYSSLFQPKRVVDNVVLATLGSGNVTLSPNVLSGDIIKLAVGVGGTNTTISFVGSKVSNGAVLFLSFDADIDIIQANNIKTPSGYRYSFTAGDSAMFFVRDNFFYLCTNKSPTSIWVTISNTTPSFQNGFGAFAGVPLKYKRDGDFVSLTGSFSKTAYPNGTEEEVFHFPASSLFPKTDITIPVRNIYGDTHGLMRIYTDGKVKFIGTGGGVSNDVGVYVGSVVFSTK